MRRFGLTFISQHNVRQPNTKPFVTSIKPLFRRIQKENPPTTKRRNLALFSKRKDRASLNKNENMEISASTIASLVIGIAGLRWLLTKCFLPMAAAAPAHPPSQSAILVTGARRGIGKATAEYLASRGYTVLVAVRKVADVDALKQESSSSSTTMLLHPVLLDVTQDAHTKPAVELVKHILQQTNTKLVAIVNNAGINPEGDTINEAHAKNQTADDSAAAAAAGLAEPLVATRVMETNVVGVIRVTRAFLPLLAHNGRIVNLGSYFGSVAGMAGLRHAAYEASKFALEGLSDNLRRGLKKSRDGRNIYVSLIKPGNVKTDMNSVFGEVTAHVVAKDIEHAIASPQPRARYYPGQVQGMPCRLICWLFEMLPSSMTDRF